MTCVQNRDGEGVTRIVAHAGSAKAEAHAPDACDSAWNHGSGWGEILCKDWESRTSPVPKGEGPDSLPFVNCQASRDPPPARPPV